MMSINGTAEHAIFTDFVGLSLGDQHSLMLKPDGSVWSTGIVSDARRETFVQVVAKGAIAVAAGNHYSIVLKEDGTVMITTFHRSKRFKGQDTFFDGSTAGSRTFTRMKIIPGAEVVVAGARHCMVLTQKGRVWTAGWNNHGQLGDGSQNDKKTFVRVMVTGTKVVGVATGDLHSMVMMQDGSVWASGRNFNGQLGDGSKSDRDSFVKVVSTGAADVAAGGYHSIVLKQDGSVWTTGWNKYGQLGDGSLAVERTIYVQAVTSGAKAVAAGSRHSMMLKQDGSVWTTGYNLYGQLGDGSTTDSYYFALVIPDAVQVMAAGAFHSMIIKEDGSVWATGSNEYGQFGDGSTTSEHGFVRVTKIITGARHGAMIPCMCA